MIPQVLYKIDRLGRQTMLKWLRDVARRLLGFQNYIVIDAKMTHIGKDVVIGEGTVIYPFTYLLGKTVIGKNCIIGPYADIRDSVLGDDVIVEHIQIKKSLIGSGVRAKHHGYLGNATVGKNVNIGAGTVTCNFDGVNKYETVIGDNAFTGTNSSIVAPRKIGKGAYIAAGSTITEDVPDNALSIGRARQVNKLDWRK